MLNAVHDEFVFQQDCHALRTEHHAVSCIMHY